MSDQTTDHHTRHQSRLQLNIETAAISIGIFFAVCLALIFIYFTRSIISLIFIAFLISLAMSGPVNLLQRRTKWQRSLCTGLSYVVVLILLGAGLAFVIPALTNQIMDLIKRFDLNEIATQLSGIGFTFSSLDNILKEVGNLSQPVFSTIASVFSQTFMFFTMLILSFHMVIDQGNMHQRVQTITRNSHYANVVSNFSHLLSRNLGGWIRGEFILMLIVGTCSFILFSLVQLPYALPLAVLAALLELIPSLGPTIAAVPAVAIGLTVSPLTALFTLIICIVIQQLENIFLVPRIMRSAAGVNPMISIVAILVGMKLMGVAGALLALPTYIFIRSFYIFFIRDKRHLPPEKIAAEASAK